MFWLTLHIKAHGTIMKDKVREKMEEFWEWFANNEKLIAEILNDDFHEGRKSLARNMDNFILQFGMFTWEMGPAEGHYYLTVSPNGNEELLEVSKELVSYAPVLRRWKFYASKPKKEWDLKFRVFDDWMTGHDVDASDWEYLIERVSTASKIGIVIAAKSIAHLDQDTKLSAADVVVTSLIGEAFKIQKVESIQIVDEFDEISAAKSKSIFKLGEEGD